MTAKEKINMMITIHTRVVTAIFLFMVIYFFMVTDFTLKIRDILGVQIIGLVSAVAYLPLMTDKEVSKRKMIIMNVVYCLTINLTVMITGLVLHWFSFSNNISWICGEIMFVSVYALMMFIAYKIDTSTAKKINEKLKERNKNRNL